MTMNLSARPAEVLSRRVGVVTGGRSVERDRSLLSGAAVAEALTDLGHTVALIDAADTSLVEAVGTVEVVFLAVAGRYGEDGKLQGFLETIGMPYTGSGVLASALGMHKPSAKAMIASMGVSVLPQSGLDRCEALDAVAVAESLVERLGSHVIVKPAGEGGSVGIAVAHGAPELAALIAAVDTHDGPRLVEPFVSGTAVTVGVLELDGELVALPALAVHVAGEFYDHAAKRDPGLHAYQCPAALPTSVADAVRDQARQAHRALGCWGYSRSDFVLDSDDRPWWLEINTLPGLSRSGNLATMAAAAGVSYQSLVAHILSTADRPTGYQP